NSLNRLIRCVCGKKIGPDPRNFNQRVSLGRNDLLIRTFLSSEGKYGDARFNNTWFGVNERQNTNSGYRKYNAGSGMSSIDYTINWQHAFTDSWSGYADFRYTTLPNRVNRSPIVKKDDYITFTIGALYNF
ncbi:MipA/OmpV family protein, partial [Klebsiella michiganensis]